MAQFIPQKYKNYNLKFENMFQFLLKVKDIDGCLMLLNKKKLKKSKILDENFFLYFETTDFCYNLIKKKHNLYVVKDLEFVHLGTNSSDKKYQYYINLNRNWHFLGQSFIFLKKIIIMLML